MGRLARRGLQTFDLPIILGVIVVLTISIVIFNLIVDVLYGLLDPRVRLAGGVQTENRSGARKPSKAPRPATSPTA
ncbi:MAG: ABC transporter permease subunit [Actinomycetota bacterium]|nr:ABC transporter permease subunit [Actinomycetota bacterium]